MEIDIKFFQTLYQNCDFGFIEIRKLPSRKQEFIPLTNIELISTICTELDQNQYFGVALRDGNGGTKDNITQIPAVWADLDFKDVPREIAHKRIQEFPFKPSVLVKSGHGVHCYWILNEPSIIEDIGIIEDINKRIADFLMGDPAACDASRILRIPGTMNIKREPHVKCEVVITDNFTYNPDDFLNILPKSQIKPVEAKMTNDKNDSWLLEAMVGVSEGNRETMATKIAGYWINKVPPSDVMTILKSWNINNVPPLEESRIISTVKSVSRYEPEKGSSILDNVYDAKKMVASYVEHVKSLKNNRFITGIAEIDKRIRGVAGGEVLTIIARAGSFKTAMLQNLLKNYLSNSAWGAIFFSIEMPVASIAERYFQISDGETGREVESTFQNDDVGKTESINQFIKDYKNLYIVPNKISLDNIPEYIKVIEAEYKIKIGVIGIDYLGLIDSPGVNEYESISRVAKGMKIVAKMLNLPFIVLSQTSREGKAGMSEVSLNMGRGSGAIEEAADFAFGLWQIEKDDETKGLVCKILKNRKGAPGSMWELDIDPKTLKITGEATRYYINNKATKGFA